ncbi:MAG TPA: hypothetical protein VFD03_06495 [Clostridia bacterium]|nr:hypothetical protein [Clostridia bacterium]
MCYFIEIVAGGQGKTSVGKRGGVMVYKNKVLLFSIIFVMTSIVIG